MWNSLFRISVTFAALTFSACASHSYRAGCTAREGDCFDATIDEKAVVRLERRDVLSPFTGRGGAVLEVRLKETKWWVPEPVSGAIDVRFGVNSLGKTWFGADPEPEVEVYPLDDQRIDTAEATHESKDVLIGGKRAAGKVDVITGDTVPPGRYLLRVKLSGSANWDRKTIFVTVR